MEDLEKQLRARYEQQAQPQFRPGQLGYGVPPTPTPDYLGRVPATPEQIRQAMDGRSQEGSRREIISKDKAVTSRDQFSSNGRTPDQYTGIVHGCERRQRENQRGYKNGRRGRLGGR